MIENKTFIQQQKEKLEQEKSDIENSLKSFATKDKKLTGDWDTKFPQFNSSDLEDSSDEVEEYENLLPIEFSLEKRLNAVNTALNNIKEEKYGYCIKCEKEIPVERLEAHPSAQTCNQCDSKK